MSLCCRWLCEAEQGVRFLMLIGCCAANLIHGGETEQTTRRELVGKNLPVEQTVAEVVVVRHTEETLMLRELLLLFF